MSLLDAHIRKYVFNPTGALKLKKDLATYAECLGGFAGGGGVARDFQRLAAIVNLFVVAPDSLMGLVNGTLRMAHGDALRYVQQREDFKSAKVDGKTLLQLFTAETAMAEQLMPTLRPQANR